MNQRSSQIPLYIYDGKTLLTNSSHAGRFHKWTDALVICLNLFRLARFQRSAGIAFHATDAFAHLKVAAKLFLKNIEAHEGVLYLYHLITL